MKTFTLVLARGELVSVRLGGRACRVSCVAGRIWVTADGRREDFVMAPGEEMTFTGRGRVVVEGLRTATARLEINAVERVNAPLLFPLERLEAGLESSQVSANFPPYRSLYSK